MKTFASMLLCIALGALAPLPATAHHSFGMFDNTREVWLEGTISEFQWTNPHAWIQVTVTGTDGAAVE